MISFNIELAVTAFSLAVVFFLSLVESAITQSSPLLLRMMMERQGESLPSLLPLAVEDRLRLLIPLHLGRQFSMITLVVLITHLSLRGWSAHGLLYSFLIVFLISGFLCQLLPRLLTQNEPEKKLVAILRSFAPFYKVLRFLAMPILGALQVFKRFHENGEADSGSADEETTDEEIQAYLEIGEDEGIFQKEDSKLIQSVVEFGNTLVREVMTPRTKIVACEENATIAELRDVMVQCRHSRIPIYCRDMDHVVGVAYIRQLMAEYAKGRESESIAGLVNPALFVPETKPVSKLLKELQERGDHTAIVIDEFGGVAGLVTIEDLVEEIVGEIRDEDEAKVSKILEEGPGSYVVRGSTELPRFEELLGRKFEGLSCATVGGMATQFLGRVPAPGEAFDMEGLRVQILDADRKRVHWMRVQVPDIESKSQLAGMK